MNTETVTIHPKGKDFEIIVQHDQSGSAYGMPLSKNAYGQLRQHFVSGSFFDGKFTAFNGQNEKECQNLLK